MPFLLIALSMFLLAAPTALAGERVLVVKGDRIEERWDPYLTPDPAPITPDPPRAQPAAGGEIKRALASALETGGIGERRHERYSRILKEAHALYDRATVGRRCRLQVSRVLAIMTTLAR